MTDRKFTIRKAVREDAALILEFIKGIARFFHNFYRSMGAISLDEWTTFRLIP